MVHGGHHHGHHHNAHHHNAHHHNVHHHNVHHHNVHHHNVHRGIHHHPHVNLVGSAIQPQGPGSQYMGLVICLGMFAFFFLVSGIIMMSTGYSVALPIGIIGTVFFTIGVVLLFVCLVTCVKVQALRQSAANAPAPVVYNTGVLPSQPGAVNTPEGEAISVPPPPTTGLQYPQGVHGGGYPQPQLYQPPQPVGFQSYPPTEPSYPPAEPSYPPGVPYQPQQSGQEAYTFPQNAVPPSIQSGAPMAPPPTYDDAVKVPLGQEVKEQL